MSCEQGTKKKEIEFALSSHDTRISNIGVGFVLELSNTFSSFAGFSASAVATSINDSDCKMVITSDGGYREIKPSI
jgi:hypothetical protein